MSDTVKIPFAKFLENPGEAFSKATSSIVMNLEDFMRDPEAAIRVSRAQAVCIIEIDGDTTREYALRQVHESSVKASKDE